MLRRCVTIVGHFSISASKIHLGSFEMSMYINFIWLHRSGSCSASDLLCPTTCHLHLCLCCTVCKCWLLFVRFCLFWSRRCEFSEVFGFVPQQVRQGLIAAGESLLCCTWSCQQMGCRAVALWVPWAGGFQETSMPDLPKLCFSRGLNKPSMRVAFSWDMYETTPHLPAGIQTVHRRLALTFFILSSALATRPSWTLSVNETS